MSYENPAYQIRREAFFTTVAGSTLEGAKFRSFQKARLKAVHVAVVTAGTNAGHGYDVYHGTTSIGTIAVGTAAANALRDSATLNETLAAMDQVSVKSLVDATGVAHVVFEYEVLPDSVQT